MRKIITTEKLPIKLWLDDIEEGALNQAKNIANLPFLFKHAAIMPDSHQGYGMPIGGVIATKDNIIPNAVGVDIGCGMCAVRTSLESIETAALKAIMSKIRTAIPLGFNKHKKIQNPDMMPKKDTFDLNSGPDKKDYPVISSQWTNALKSLGTLGGGNHFIEIQKGSDGFIWIMIHSGSRNLGLQVAESYNKLAMELNKEMNSPVPKKWELAYLPIDHPFGNNYIREMNYCVDYALANRSLMMDRIKEIIYNIVTYQLNEQIDFGEMINIAHNYADFENHFGEDVIVHRKGATKAYKGLTGIIPGSQGTKSFIVEGRGNEESFMSCSHGAGRLMSRSKATKTLNLEKEIAILDKKGIIHGIRHKKDLDEAPSAYKNIDVVMRNQKDLVKILVELSPLAVIKG